MAQWIGDRLDLPFESVQELDVSVVGGEVSVSAGASARVEVEVLEGPEIEVSYERGRLRISHRAPSTILGKLLGNVKASVAVVVPEATPASIETVGADLFVAGLRAATTATTVSGDLTATGLDGRLALKTVSGELDVQDV